MGRGINFGCWVSLPIILLLAMCRTTNNRQLS